MPKTACPACKADVKYPRDAELGTEVTCPECDEVFVPPKLQIKLSKKKYDPYEEEAYAVERPIDDPDAEAKNKKVAAAAYHAAEREREEKRPTRRPRWFEGPEIWLLIFAVGATGGAPFGFWLARNWEQMGGVKFFWLMVGLCVVFVIALSLAMSSWAWLRRNR